ncbi:hypothetical protein CRG98_010427 [Punica granatum]|uniref:Uncharacterized protein n=1 Tax=Punica granatum TaxID=22663 RepID=A0A2I0KLG0_PUNGR|nr:hypothetical protein CRG98_010427 [Punica granatum]
MASHRVEDEGVSPWCSEFQFLRSREEKSRSSIIIFQFDIIVGVIVIMFLNSKCFLVGAGDNSGKLFFVGCSYGIIRIWILICRGARNLLQGSLLDAFGTPVNFISLFLRDFMSFPRGRRWGGGKRQRERESAP